MPNSPQEQIEDVARNIEVAVRARAYDIVKEAYPSIDEFDPDRKAEYLAMPVERLRREIRAWVPYLAAISFDSPQISEGEVTVTLSREEAEWLVYDLDGITDSPALSARSKLSAALTQKGEA